jgi:hypothetical protein
VRSKTWLTIHLDETVSRQDKIPYGQADEIDHHPPNVDYPACCDQDQDCGQTEHSDEQDDGNSFLEVGRGLQSGVDDQSIGEAHSYREDDRSEESATRSPTSARLSQSNSLIVPTREVR